MRTLLSHNFFLSRLSAERTYRAFIDLSEREREKERRREGGRERERGRKLQWLHRSIIERKGRGRERRRGGERE